MPIRIPDRLPARKLLESEGVMVMDERTALRQDIRPMRIALLNLMPDKIRTEAQIARLVGSTPLQVEMTLMRIGSHVPRNTSQAHLLDFYKTWEEVREEKFDGLIITGAPIETLEFQDVTYWDELTKILDWSCTNVHSLFTICWGAMAAAHHFHGVPKFTLDQKAFGVFRHRNLNPTSPYLAGFSDDFSIPVSRWTEVRSADIEGRSQLELLMDSDVTGPCLVAENAANRLYIFNHIEYDSTSLAEEYARDIAVGGQIELPQNYFPGDDPKSPPQNRWRSHAHLLFRNWIHTMYQGVPYDLDAIGSK
jgi:homoserine O-succinyltransferase